MFGARDGGELTKRVYELIKALPPVGIGNLSPKKICTTALAFVTVIACATSASAQSVPSASPTTSFAAALQSQNPLSPLYSDLNEESTNFRMGPLYRTQDVLLVEPVIPIRLTPDFNLVTRWITPVIWQPALAPSIGSEFRARQYRTAVLLYASTSGERLCLGPGRQRLVSDRDRQDVRSQQVGWRADRSGVVDPGSSAFRRPCQPNMGRGPRLERDLGRVSIKCQFGLSSSTISLRDGILPLSRSLQLTGPYLITNGQCRSAAALGG